MEYTAELSFFSPSRRHFVDLANLQLAAQQRGITVHVIRHREFRNYQRFGVRTMQTFLVLRNESKELLRCFVDGICVG